MMPKNSESGRGDALSFSPLETGRRRSIELLKCGRSGLALGLELR
jgi:hypothetical protein